MMSTMQLCTLLVHRAPLALLLMLGLVVSLHAAQVRPTITWSMPTPFVYGTSIPAAIATDKGVPVAGTFTYNPPLNTILHVTGRSVSLRADFVPANNSAYRTVSARVRVTVTRAPLMVTASASKAYGAVVTAPVVSYNGFRFSDSASVLSGAPTTSHAVAVGSNAGNYSIAVGVGSLSATDYQIVASNGIYTVSKAPLTVTASASKIYGDAVAAPVASYSGFKLADTVSVLNGAPTMTHAVVTGSTVGSYPITVSVGTLTATNYQIASANGSYSVKQAGQSISFAPLMDVAVGAPDQTLVASATSGLPVAFAVSGPATITAGQLHVTGEGVVTVTATQVGDANYFPATPVPQSITVTAGGTGLLASYFANESVSGTPVLTRLEAQINYDWANGSPASVVPVDSFSARWDGEIMTRFAEAYTLTFRTDDGVRVWLDGQLVVNYWNLRSAADSNYTFTAEANRRYRVRIEYYEHTGLAVAKLLWRSAREPAGPIPASHLFPTPPDTSGPIGTGTGLTAAYFTNETLSGLPALTRVDAGLIFDWAGGSPASGIPADSFSVRWSGEIQPRYTETYTLVLRTDDGVRVWLNGQSLPVINAWVLRGATDSICTFDAVAGQRYAIHIEYFERQGSAVAQMSWYSARESGGLVPATQLYPVPLPVANDDVADTAVATPVSIPVLANDVSADAAPLLVASVGGAANGVTAVNPDLQSVTYTPNANFTGTDLFSYVLVDGHGRSAIGYVTVTVQSPVDLVLQWKFDEQTGIIARDSARTHDATIYGGTRILGKQNGAITVNAGIVQAPDATDMHLQRMTIALWMKPSQTFASMGTYAGLFDRLDWADNSGFYFGGFGPGTNQIALMLMNGPDQDSRAVIAYDEVGSGDWVHLAAVYDGDSMFIYRNGAVVATQVVGALSINYRNGWPLNVGGGYTGSVDDVRVYARALSVADIAVLVGANPDNTPPLITMGPDRSVTLPATAAINAIVSDDGRPAGAVQLTWSQIAGPAVVQFSNSTVANPTVSFTAAGPYALRLKASDGDLSTVSDVYVTVFAPDDVTRGLVGHWKFDETTGMIAADSSGRQHDASITNGPATWEQGYLGNGQHFTGVNHLASSADSADLRVQQLTVSAWVRADRNLVSMTSPYPSILSKQDWDVNGGYYFGDAIGRSGTIGLRLMTGADTYARVETQVPYTDAVAWHHVCAVYDGSYLRIYRDGEEMPGSVRVGPLIINHNAAPLIMGQGFEGVLDDVRLYNRALSPSEVDTLLLPSNSG